MGNFQSVQFGSCAVAPAGNGNKPKGHYHGYDPRPFVSKADVHAHLSDARYNGKEHERSPAFQAYCEACLAMTPDAVLGVGTGVLEAAMSEPRQNWQDLNGDLDKDVSTYHTIEESQADIGSARYKKDPYFREQAARKIERSTPNAQVEFPKHQSVKVDRLNPEAGEDSEYGYVSADGQSWTE